MNPNVLAFFSALRGVLIAVGAAMVSLNMGQTHYYGLVMQASGLVMVVGPLLWAVFEKLVTLKKTLAAAVQAGIDLVMSGEAVDKEGKPISSLDPDAAPPRQVTVASAAQIIKDLAPPPSSIEKK
jgi:hypothetical protein